MNHKVNNVQNLFDDAKTLYNVTVTGSTVDSAETLISNLQSGIDILKNCWEGKDAGVQIQNLIVVYNGMVGIRNSLGALAETTTKIASNYREIQNSNGAGLESLTPVANEIRTTLPDYSDNRDTINISPEAVNGNQKVTAANSEFDNFTNKAKYQFDAIMNNWTAGPGRDQYQDEFNSFLANANKYKELLNQVSNSVTTAIKNYGM